MWFKFKLQHFLYYGNNIIQIQILNLCKKTLITTNFLWRDLSPLIFSADKDKNFHCNGKSIFFYCFFLLRLYIFPQVFQTLVGIQLCFLPLTLILTLELEVSTTGIYIKNRCLQRLFRMLVSYSLFCFRLSSLLYSLGSSVKNLQGHSRDFHKTVPKTSSIPRCRHIFKYVIYASMMIYIKKQDISIFWLCG